MGALAPLYLAGLGALSLPLILHLVRRTPRGRQVFSSLMFLAPTPPRLARRSRLDQLLLLALRLAALALLSLAFARPFLRESALLSLSNVPARKLAILLDTSASLRRDNLWEQAIAAVERELGELLPQDQVALFTFDEQLRAVVDFGTEAGGPAELAAADSIRRQLPELAPRWNSTNLGDALVRLAGQLEATDDVQQATDKAQILLVTDLQRGCRLDPLQAYEWPDNVAVVVRPVLSTKTTNAYARLLTGETDAPNAEVRVRVVNSRDSRSDQFSVEWLAQNPSSPNGSGPFDRPDTRPVSPTSDSSGKRAATTYVPPGESRVMKMPRGADDLLADQLVLRGDEQTFDNVFYLVPPKQQEVRVVYLGRDVATDPQGHQYYLRLAMGNDPLRQVAVDAPPASAQPASILASPIPAIVVVTRPLAESWLETLRSYVQQGGTLLAVPEDEHTARQIAAFADDVEFRPVAAPEAAGSREKYLILSEIQFNHPVFAALAEPQYSDFTKIHFWKHWPLSVDASGGTRIVARFDNGDPALLERELGAGRILVLGAGWRPDDSDLALSSKFVPLIGGLLDQACGGTVILPSVTVGEPIGIPPALRSSDAVVQPPGGTPTELRPGSTRFTDTHEPGIYQIRDSTTSLAFAVNLDPDESDTAALSAADLEQAGVRVGDSGTRADRWNRVRQQRDAELEGRQKLWRWLIVAVLGVLLIETWWAGRETQQVHRSQEPNS